MSETIAAAKEWISFVALCASLLTPLFLLWLKSQFATKDEIARLKDSFERFSDKCGEQFAPKDLTLQFGAHALRIDRLEDRVASVEGEMKHLPDKQVTHRLELAMSEMRGEMRAMTEKMAPVAATSERLQEFLLDQAKGPKNR